jgi:hypothetical protein
MIEPERIGRFLAVDQSGHVQPDVAIDRIGSDWKPLVDFVTQSLLRRHDVRSVYIRGSIPRGLAIAHVSDADFIYLSETNFDLEDAALEEAARTKFSFVDGVTIFRLSGADFARIHPPRRRPYFHMLLKTQSLFLAGDDVVADVEPFRIGPDMVSHAFSLAHDFKNLRERKMPPWLGEDQKRLLERSARQWISKRIVRAGLEVTMDRSDRFTRDLYLCYEQFARYYPAQAAQMYAVLVNCLNGEESADRYEELTTFLTRESAGLRALF